MEIIRRLAANSYAKELKGFISQLTRAESLNKIPSVLVYGTWLRAMLQVEGNIDTIKDENKEFDAELHSYPIMLREIEDCISLLKKKKDFSKVFALSIWVHSLRSILRPELNGLSKEMWKTLMAGKDKWDSILIGLHDEDIKLGIDTQIVKKTENLSRLILTKLPPKQLYKA